MASTQSLPGSCPQRRVALLRLSSKARVSLRPAPDSGFQLQPMPARPRTGRVGVRREPTQVPACAERGDNPACSLVELRGPAQRLADGRRQVPRVPCCAPGQLLALGVVHVANVVKCPRLPNLWVTLRLVGGGGASPKPQPPRSRPLRPCAQSWCPIAWPTVPAVPQAPKARAWRVAAPGLDTKVAVTGREGRVPTPPGHPSLTPKGQGSASAQPPPRRPGASQSPQPQFPRPYRGRDAYPTGPRGEDTEQGCQGSSRAGPTIARTVLPVQPGSFRSRPPPPSPSGPRSDWGCWWLQGGGRGEGS